MSDLLLELFSEEIPARMQTRAADELVQLLTKQLTTAQLHSTSKESITAFVTPRRLSVWIKDLPNALPATEQEVKGPKTSAPEQAISGFLKKNNVTKNDLVERDGIYFITLKQDAQDSKHIIKNAIEDILPRLSWPKSMRWGDGDQTWVRPLHSMICLFGSDIIPIHFAGITASNTTLGHRFLHSGEITINTAHEYETKLENAHVIVNHNKRKAIIIKQAEEAAQKAGLILKQDEGLLNEVTGLVEYPLVLIGTIDADYMTLPQEVLISEMRAHQKYFALEHKGGTLADKFLITANISTNDNGAAIIAGNERVLRARLADGQFFWDQDRKKELRMWAEDLHAVTFHTKLGTIADKVDRVSALAETLTNVIQANKDDVKRAAQLCKADLVTGMVGEFPDLQGIMGRYYAHAQGEKSEVAEAIAEHYLPLGPATPVPTAPISTCIALADKLDTLISMFSIDEKPTGSKDPFALRRAALGVIRIVLENNLRLKLRTWIDNTLFDFFIDRLKVQLKTDGIRHDVISAVVDNSDDDLLRIVERAKALQDFINNEDGINLLTAYKRAANILSIEEKKDNTRYLFNDLDEKKLRQKEEIDLAALLPKRSKELTILEKEEKFAEAMTLLASLRDPIDLFFDKIMVNDQDDVLRANRLRLLSAIRECMDSIANFALIEGDIKEQKKAA